MILSACSQPSLTLDEYGSAITQKRQKQKLVVLQKKLDSAEREQKQVERDVEILKEELRQAELELIRRSVESCEFKLARHQRDHVAGLFLEEREMLHKMIQSGSTPASFEAQVVLDQILRIITNFSEQQ